MAPAVRLKRSSTQTITLPPPDARLAVRDVMRSTIPSRPAEAPASTERPAPAAALQGFLCLEEVDGRRWSYVVDGGSAKGRGSGGVAVPAGASVRAVPLQSPLPPAEVSSWVELWLPGRFGVKIRLNVSAAVTGV
jgi:hypothetical protein